MATGNITSASFTVAAAKRKGSFPDADKAVAFVREHLAQTEQDRAVAMYEAAILLHNVVTVSGTMKQGDYMTAIGKSKASGTLYARLARAAVVHNVSPGSPEWTYLVQRGTSAVAGQAVSLEAPREAKAALKKQAAEWRENGKVTTDAKRRTGGTTKQTTKQRKQVETVNDVLAVLHGLESVITNLSDKDALKVSAAMLKQGAAIRHKREAAAKAATKQAATA